MPLHLKAQYNIDDEDYIHILQRVHLLEAPWKRIGLCVCDT